MDTLNTAPCFSSDVLEPVTKPYILVMSQVLVYRKNLFRSFSYCILFCFAGKFLEAMLKSKLNSPARARRVKDDLKS